MIKLDNKELKDIFNNLRDGKENAFVNFYSKYNKLIYSIAFSILKNRSDAEDIVQIVFTKIYSLEKYKLPTKSEASWIYSLTKNETISFLRKKNNCVNIESIYEIEDRSDYINKIIDQDAYSRLISKLNNKEKEIVSLKLLADLPFKEIGKLLNEPTATIKWRYYKAINTLKLLLGNLTAYIITLIAGLKILNIKNEITQNKNQEETNKTEVQDENENISEDIESEMKQENITTQTQEVSHNQYLGIGILSISAIFLIITIFFAIIFVKHQLKPNRKTSK